ncbi:MAG TPA: outer membrane protein assembly factor BamD [Thermohalobaculum sp.]|nr:outer membrane protein assembly factor BamD [Thermohalobaculum sp.]
MIMRRTVRLAGIVVLAATLAGCSRVGGLFGGDDDEPTLEDLTAEQIYSRGTAELEDGDAEAAAETFDEIERLYPFSQLAKRAMIMSAYASYEAGDMASARAAARRYLDLYPADEDAAYAQYLIGLTHYDVIVDIGRDQSSTQEAQEALTTTVQRYPRSEFARDAQLKIDLTDDHLAGKEMSVGRYYLKRKHYTAALNRFSRVIEDYQTTSQTPEALHRMVEANLALGLDDEAFAAATVLGYNFPGSDWYARTYKLWTGREVLPEPDQSGTLSTVYRRVILGEWL